MEQVLQFDGNLLIGIQQSLNADWLTPIMKFITLFGEHGYYAIAVCLVLLLFKKTRRLGIICSLSLLLAFICCNVILKNVVGRARPWEVFDAVHPYLPHPGDSSFPSGHSSNTMGPAWGMFLATMPGKKDTGGGIVKSYDDVPCLGWKGVGVDARTMHKIAIGMVILALLVGISRLYLGMHYPSDVIVGLLLGMISATIANYAVGKYEEKHGIIGKVKD